MKLKTNVIWIILLFIVFIVATTLTIIYDLYSVMGTVGTVVFNFLIYAGVIGALEIDDWTIWYKRLVIKKYLRSSGYFECKIYFKNMKKRYIKLPVTIEDYFVTHARKVIFFTKFKNIHPTLSVNDNRKLYFTINPITNGITICDNLGNDFNPKKLQVYTTKEGYTDMIENVAYLIDTIVRYIELSDNTTLNNITINKDSITFKKKQK